MHRSVLPVLAALLAAAPALAQDAARGRETYLRHCVQCHGIDAEGHGPTAAVLTLQPADLTRLSLSNGGVFPTERVVMRIDGREPLVSHGSPMPIYGGFFEGRDRAMKAPSGRPILTSEPVVDLVAWLESIQD
ncbi:MAG: c-type cytochrome [Cereibacter sp.]|jgi:mono/diheme cytochrome c family protein|nr:c-type cytochrome [Cereibacter sp.]